MISKEFKDALKRAYPGTSRGLLEIGADEQAFITYLLSLASTKPVRKGLFKGLFDTVNSYRLLTARERAAVRFCQSLHDQYGICFPNEPIPERILKALDTKKASGNKVQVRFSDAEIKEMGLKWVTAHPNGTDEKGVPILVKDLGDEYMVVGGAGGTMNFTRFRKRTDDAVVDIGKKTKQNKKHPPEMTDEEYEQLSAKAEEAKAKKKEAQSQLMQRVREYIGALPELTDEEKKKLEEKALAKAKELALSPEGTKDFVQQALSEHQRKRQKAADKAVADAVSEIETAAGIEAITGQPVTPEHLPGVPEEGADGKPKPVRMPITREQFEELKGLAAEAANAASYESSIKRALNKGGAEVARAMELAYQPLTPEEQAKYFEDKHLKAEELRLNSALVDATNGQGVGMALHVARGAAMAGAGIAGAAVGTTVLDSATAQRIGIAASAQIIARYIAQKTGSPEKAALALREFIGKESSSKAAAAVMASRNMRKQGLEMAQAAIAQGLMEKDQAYARAMQYGNEGDRIMGECAGALETAAQVAMNLDSIASGRALPVTIAGGSSEAAAKQKVIDLGLSNADTKQYSLVRVKGEGWQIKLTDDGVKALYHEQSLTDFEADAEIQEIKERGQGEGWEDENGVPWAADGQNENVQLMPHQQANVKLWERQKNLLVTDEAGSGKTATALCGISHLHKAGKVKKVLVVVPKTVLKQFGTEIAGDPTRGWSGFLAPEYHDQYQLIDGMSKAKRNEAYGGDKLITVITHDMLRNDFEAIKAAGFDCMVVDEAHYFTTRGNKEGTEGSMRSQRARELDMPYKMLMTGTPVRNDLSELYSLADWLQPGCLGSRKEFMAKYGKLSRSEGPFDEGLMRGLQQRLSGVITGITLSSEKDENGQRLFEFKSEATGKQPVKCYEHTLSASLTDEQRKAYAAEEASYLAKRKAKEKVNPLTRDQHHKRTVNNVSIDDHPKVRFMRDIAQKHPDEKMVIFAQNGYSHDTIIRGMGLKPSEYAIINGDTSAEKRAQIAAALKDPNSPVKYVICSDAANFGLNMQGASVLVNYDACDTYATHRQRIARLFRKGQSRNVTVYNLRTDTPFERKAQERIEAKKRDQTLVENLSTIDDSGLYGIFAKHFGRA